MFWTETLPQWGQLLWIIAGPFFTGLGVLTMMMPALRFVAKRMRGYFDDSIDARPGTILYVHRGALRKSYRLVRLPTYTDLPTYDTIMRMKGPNKL